MVRRRLSAKTKLSSSNVTKEKHKKEIRKSELKGSSSTKTKIKNQNQNQNRNQVRFQIDDDVDVKNNNNNNNNREKNERGVTKKAINDERRRLKKAIRKLKFSQKDVYFKHKPLIRIFEYFVRRQSGGQRLRISKSARFFTHIWIEDMLKRCFSDLKDTLNLNAKNVLTPEVASKRCTEENIKHAVKVFTKRQISTRTSHTDSIYDEWAILCGKNKNKKKKKIF